MSRTPQRGYTPFDVALRGCVTPRAGHGIPPSSCRRTRTMGERRASTDGCPVAVGATNRPFLPVFRRPPFTGFTALSASSSSSSSSSSSFLCRQTVQCCHPRRPALHGFASLLHPPPLPTSLSVRYSSFFAQKRGKRNDTRTKKKLENGDFRARKRTPRWLDKPTAYLVARRCTSIQQ